MITTTTGTTIAAILADWERPRWEEEEDAATEMEEAVAIDEEELTMKDGGNSVRVGATLGVAELALIPAAESIPPAALDVGTSVVSIDEVRSMVFFDERSISWAEVVVAGIKRVMV
jgi:hypothetical protein